MGGAKNDKGKNRYNVLTEKVFFDRYQEGSSNIEFERGDLIVAAQALGIKLPKNIGDVVYSVRYRTSMPDSVLELQPKGMEWIIEGVGRAKYVFRLVPINRIVPNPELVVVKIPDATPEIVGAYALSDEQALLAKLRYNRLIDIFLGLAAYSLQNHLRTTVASIGQVEIDEIYVAVDRQGRQFVLPVQAKGGRDQLSVVQAKQDIACCAEKYPHLICRAISAQFMANDVIALFELVLDGEMVRVAEEKHYRLVPADRIDVEDLASYSVRAS
jgi:hypothetical protein